jgi:hypothetical protein
VDKKWYQSNTIRLALATIAGALAAYFSGELTGAGAAALLVSGILQIIQREYALKKVAGAPAAPIRRRGGTEVE